MLAALICGLIAKRRGRRWWSWGLLGLMFQWVTAALLLAVTASATPIGIWSAWPLLASAIGLALAVASVHFSFEDEEWQKAQGIWLS